jgi:GDP-L-fucose synthase
MQADWPDSPLYWGGKRVVVTGGAGFLGSFVVERLRAAGAEVFVARHRDYDLVQLQAARDLLADAKPEVIFHLAARVGGIGANREHPGAFFYDNLMMGTQLMHEAYLNRVSKFVA